MHWLDAIVIVALSGTPVPLAEEGNFVYLYVQAHESNTKPCMIGTSSVVAAMNQSARGVIVPQPSPAMVQPFRPLFIRGPGALGDLYIDAVNDGDSITYFGLMR